MANGYGKRPLWKWILLYIVIGAIIYGLAYYFVIAKKGGYNYDTNNSQQTPSTKNSTNSTQNAKNSVEIANFNFSPATLNVKVGDTVIWTNQDSMSHSATADDKSFDTGILDQGKSGSVTFSKAGTYTYHCSVHPNMHGTIIVQ